MIYIIGDIHGNFRVMWAQVQAMIDQHDGERPSAIIQIGDFGYYPEFAKAWDRDTKYHDIPVYFIDGNHENFDYLARFNENGWKNLFYIERGSVMNFEGKWYGFLGGAESPDVNWRVKNISWWEEERISQADVDRLIQNFEKVKLEHGIERLDYFITHAPPISVIRTHFPPLDHKFWNLDQAWRDESAFMVQQAWQRLGSPKIVSGHMHKSIYGAGYCILEKNELVVVLPSPIQF
jgi:Icc-related predicted phosphoesterase